MFKNDCFYRLWECGVRGILSLVTAANNGERRKRKRVTSCGEMSEFGRRSTIGNRVGGKPSQGFESPSLRHFNQSHCGGVAQLARAFGSYPEGRGFESLRRYQFHLERYQSGQMGRTVNPLRKLRRFESFSLHHFSFIHAGVMELAYVHDSKS